jgi:hypothetical protein
LNLKIISALALSGALVGCGLNKMSKNSDELLDLSRSSSNRLNTSVDAIVEAKKFTAYKEMLEDKNTEVLTPIPFRMIIPGKKLAAIITGEELAQLTYVQMKEINEYQCDSIPTADQGKSLHDKLARLYSLMIIAAWAPQSTIEDMIKTQIQGATMFQGGALAALALRYTFLSEVMMDQSLMSGSGFANVGQLEEAVKTNTALDYLTSLTITPFVKVKVLGFCKVEGGDDYTRFNRVITVDSTKVPAYWKDINEKAIASQQVDTTSLGEKSINANFANRYQAVVSIIKLYLIKWGLK